jgi:prepilin-type N-terminal cleavage/methylation domain-containing protein
MKQKNNQGFTLIELLVVIAIIGLLAGIIMLALSNARVRGRDSKRIGDMRQMISSMEQYYTQNGAYPTGTDSMSASGALLSAAGSLDGGGEAYVPNYVGLLPSAPEPADGNCLGDPGRGNNNYWYDAAPDGTTYTITFCLGKDNESWLSGTRYVTPSGVQ